MPVLDFVVVVILSGKGSVIGRSGAFFMTTVLLTAGPSYVITATGLLPVVLVIVLSDALACVVISIVEISFVLVVELDAVTTASSLRNGARGSSTTGI